MYYTFTGATKVITPWSDGTKVVVRQIQSIKMIFLPTKIIPAGTIGGWIESEANLPQDSESWVDEESVVCQRAVVNENSLIEMNSLIVGDIECEGGTTVKASKILYRKKTEESEAIYLNNSILEHCLFEHPNYLSSFNCIMLEVIGTSSCSINISNEVDIRKCANLDISVSGKVLFLDCQSDFRIEGKHVTGRFEGVKFHSDIYLHGNFDVMYTELRNVDFVGNKTFKMLRIDFYSQNKAVISADVNWSESIIYSKSVSIQSPTIFKNLVAPYLNSLVITGKTTLKNVVISPLIRNSFETTELLFYGQENVMDGNPEEGIELVSNSLQLSNVHFSGSFHAKVKKVLFYDSSCADFSQVISEADDMIYFKQITMKDSSKILIGQDHPESEPVVSLNLEYDECFVDSYYQKP